ncbi:hypothetical protein [Ktedonospora formicarum]|uniref:hypothetical protein n=1 Tax=Ktedonospora formicarum TaxID=2778364 RepID=UPI001C689DD1|nr:hypothetical protein [Ktedonospora formicarum]
MNANEYSNLRIRKDTQRKLKLVAALSEESMLDVLDRLVSQELERLQREGTRHHAALYKDQD